jgi:small-conductance mechanosensitive channel
MTLRHVIVAGFVLTLSLHAVMARGGGVWEGFWEAYSVGEDAYLSMRQDGDRVIGTYFPYNGRLEGIAENGVLTGTWHSPNGSGSFTFAMAPDGLSFSGSIGSGEWWNGRRIDEDDVGALNIDLRDPGRAVRSFLDAGRAFRNGEISGLQAMFSALHFSGDAEFAEKSRRAQALYDLLNLTTFRLFDIRPASGNRQPTPPRFPYRFAQAGSGEAIDLWFRRDVFELWRIEAPPLEDIERQRTLLLAARGWREADPTRYRELASPRDAVEAFIVGMRTWAIGGREMVRDSLDLSAVSENLRDTRLPVVATFLARSLNRIGRLTLEEIPDDPARTRPFVLYQHAVGDIVLTRSEDATGRQRWHFSSASVDAAKELHDALRSYPVEFDNVDTPPIDNAYLRARSIAYRLAPQLMSEFRGVELWQWLGLLLLALVLPLALHLGLSRFGAGLAATAGNSPGPAIMLLRLYGIGGLWVLSATGLGLSNGFSSALYAMGWVLIIVGVTWQLYRLVGVVSGALGQMAQRTATTADDLAVTLLSGTARILLVLGATIAIADVLGIPYRTVLAGIGVSGLALAIASRDLLANLFGSVIIASDRPFSRGDFISVGSTTGTVERVGLRSTRLRPVDDTTVSIPNSAIATDRVVNLSRRRRMRVLETIHVSHDATIDAVRDLRERLLATLHADPVVFEENVRVGLATVSLYAVEMEISFYIKTTNYDEFLYEKHRLLAQLLSVLEAAGVARAVVRRD